MGGEKCQRLVIICQKQMQTLKCHWFRPVIARGAKIAANQAFVSIKKLLLKKLKDWLAN